MAEEKTELEKERGSFMIMWREDVKMLRETISDEERRVIVEALFDWFLGQEMALTGLLGMVLTNLIEKQKRGVEFRNAKQEAGRRGAEKRWGKHSKNSKGMASDSKPMAKRSTVMASDSKPMANGKQAHGTAIANDSSNSNSNSNSNSVGSNEPTVIGVADGDARVMSETDGNPNLVSTPEADVTRKRTPPTLEKVLSIARTLGIDADWARNFHADMTADNWCFINASGNTAIVNALNVGGVMRKRFKWANERKSGKGANQPAGVNLQDAEYDFSKFEGR